MSLRHAFSRAAVLLTMIALSARPVLASPATARQREDPLPATAAELRALRHGGDLHTQRRLAWQIITSLTDSAAGEDRPRFESWHGEDEVFGDGAVEHARTGISGFSRSSSSDHAEDPSSDDASQIGDVPVLTYALYDDAAYDHIRDQQLNRRAELERLRRTGVVDTMVAGDRSIPPFPTGATVLKTVWWPVAAAALSALPVWDPDRNPIGRGGNDYLGWPRVVAVDATRAADRPAFVSIDFAGRTFPHAQRIELAAFCHVMVDAEMADRLSRDRSARKTALVALGRPLAAGDYLVLVSANLASKEIDDWVWATFWWHDRPDEGAFAADRPAALQGAWRNYLMQVAFDSTIPAAADGGPHACFDPWLEGRFPDGGHGAGAVSNCMTCHRRASYPAVDFLPVTRGEPDLAGDPAYAPGRLRTGMLWSIALHARP